MEATGGLGGAGDSAERPLATPPAGPESSAGPEAAPRPQFGSYLEFLLVSIGLAVGLGNLASGTLSPSRPAGARRRRRR